jgi:predicted kinase
VEDSRLLSDVQRLMESLGELPEPVAEPTFIAVSGLPGTGKSYFCHRLAQVLPLVILESDALRKELFPQPGYSPEESARLFRALHFLIERLLKKGISLVLDATNLSERFRERLYSIADRLGVKLILVRVEAPPQVVYERLKVRQREGQSKSDADWTVYQKMKATAEKMHHNHYAVDTSRDITPVVEKVVREARR